MGVCGAGGNNYPLPMGITASHAYANYGADSGYSGLALGMINGSIHHLLAHFPPNAFGLYDMQGNVLQ